MQNAVKDISSRRRHVLKPSERMPGYALSAWAGFKPSPREVAADAFYSFPISEQASTRHLAMAIRRAGMALCNEAERLSSEQPSGARTDALVVGLAYAKPDLTGCTIAIAERVRSDMSLRDATELTQRICEHLRLTLVSIAGAAKERTALELPEIGRDERRSTVVRLDTFRPKPLDT